MIKKRGSIDQLPSTTKRARQRTPRTPSSGLSKVKFKKNLLLIVTLIKEQLVENESKRIKLQ